MYQSKEISNRETIAALNDKCLSYSPSFPCIINPFLNSRISDNHDKVKILLINGILIKGILLYIESL